MLVPAQSQTDALRRFLARANGFDAEDVKVFEGLQLDHQVVKQMLPPHVADVLKTNILYTEFFVELYANAG
jgi:hypothetical protein